VVTSEPELFRGVIDRGLLLERDALRLARILNDALKMGGGPMPDPWCGPLRPEGGIRLVASYHHQSPVAMRAGGTNSRTPTALPRPGVKRRPAAGQLDEGGPTAG